jgi:hypothetical protein
MARLPANQKHRQHTKRWKRYEKQQPGHRLQMEVKFLERIPGTWRRLYQFTEDCYDFHRPHGSLSGQTPYERLLEKTKAKRRAQMSPRS